MGEGGQKYKLAGEKIKIRYASLIPDLSGKATVFHYKNEVIRRYFIDVLCHIEKDPFYSYFAENLSGVNFEF